jgi:DNA-binding response OmpR family regulator
VTYCHNDSNDSNDNNDNNNTLKNRDKKVKNKILLVDDDSDACLTFKKMLEERGFDTDAYDKPQDALQNFKSAIYDLIVLDIKMPKIDGVKLYQEIRKIDKKVRVCFITASEEYYTKQFPELKEEECFMQKPISMDDFIDRVKLALASLTRPAYNNS